MIGPYTLEAWLADRSAEAAGQRLECPDCRSRIWFRPVGVPPETGAERKYRACKICGFWQNADGTPPYRCYMTAHVCLAAISEDSQCCYCGAWGPIDWHSGCWRILPAGELGVTQCVGCGVVLGPMHVVPWPKTAD